MTDRYALAAKYDNRYNPDGTLKEGVEPTGIGDYWRDIKKVAPGAARTGVEMAPALETQTEWIPALTRWIIQNSPFTTDEAKVQALRDFAEANAPFHQAMEEGPIAGIDNPFKRETIKKYVTDPVLGPQPPEPQAETVPGKIVQRGLEIGPSMLTGPGNLLQKTVATGGAATGGVLASEAAKNMGLSPAWQTAADVGGSLMGGVLPEAYNRIVQPNPIPPARQPSIDYLRTRNIPMSVGQMTGNERLLRAERMAGGPEAWDQQGPAFTRAATEEQGGFPPGTDTLTNDVMRREFDRMGAEFDRLERAAPPTLLGNQIVSDLHDIVDNYHQTTPHTAPIVQTIVDEIQQNAAANGGFIDGVGYQSVRSRIGKIVRASDDPHIQSALMEVQDVLDNMMSLGLSPADQHAFRTVRAQYRNMLPIEFAKSGQGADRRLGAIDPQSLMTGIRNVEGRREVAAGDRGMTQLAEAGGGILTRPTSSGTAENLRAMLAHLATIGMGGIGAGLGALSAMPEALGAVGGGLGLAAGAAGPYLRNMLLTSQAGQNFIGRNLAPRIDTARSDLTALLAAAAAGANRYQGDMTRR